MYLDRLTPALRAPRLSLVMLVLFVCLSIPILIFILLYNYQRNAAVIVSTLDQAVANTSQVSIEYKSSQHRECRKPHLSSRRDAPSARRNRRG